MTGFGQPGVTLFVQTFGDLVNFHPHIHVLAADGVFTPKGTFRVFRPLPKVALMQTFRGAVIVSIEEGG